MTEQCWLILGASSAMARAFGRAVSARGAQVLLAGRDTEDLDRLAADCRLRGASGAEVLHFDAREPDGFAAIEHRFRSCSGTLNIACFVGAMPDQTQIDADPAILPFVIADNLSGPAELIQRLVPEMEARESGAVVGVGSVAGDRGRLGNYVYGAAKAGFHAWLSGLRNRLGRSGVHVLTVKPGFVDTAMTWGIEGMFLLAPPDRVAKDILSALSRRRNVIYTPPIWRVIMTIIWLIPEPIFKKLKI